MCGILGSVNFLFSEETLNLLAHRGPDDRGSYEVTVGRHSICLAQTRLAIVDLSATGHQPMVSACGHYIIIFNGEIYNHLELREKLREIHFRGHSDTETILYYIAKYGLSGVNDLNGIFAFAFLDKKRKTILLCRDPFGVKPLYYWRQAEKLIFASEIRPIQQLVRDTVEIDNIATLLRLRYSPSPDTIFKNIHKVRPGHVISIELAKSDLGMAVSSFAFTPQPSDTSSTLVDAVDRYGYLLQQAIERQLMSDVEVGILLSGGIDSALVAKFAQATTSRPIKAFTVGFKDQDESDEIIDAQSTASIIGLESIVTRVGFDDFLKIIHDCISIIEEPLATTSVIPMYYLAKLASRDVKVVLSGQGADESLGGYGRYQGELYRSFSPPFLAKLFRPIASLLGVRNTQLMRGLHALQYTDDIPRFLSAYSVFQDDEIKRLIGIHDNKSQNRLEYEYNLLACANMKTSVERMMAIDLRMNLADDLLLYTDKITMHFSLECRVPMLDLGLVKFIVSLPYHYRLKLRQSKIIHREFAKRVLPHSIINRKKKGFQSPTKKWFRRQGPLRDMASTAKGRFSCYSVFFIGLKILHRKAVGYV